MKLSIFVSSTINECADERDAARRAITSVNLEPILFENVGARPHPPRDVYQPELERSHIFVGIYRESYGWVAPSMSISGVEDELRLAKALGLPRLIYIAVSAPNREERLIRLLEELAREGDISYAKYHDPNRLFEQIRDDLTDTISDQYLLASRATSVQAVQPEHSLRQLLLNPTYEIPRSETHLSIQPLFDKGPVVVHGAMGIGKSVFIAQLARDRRAPYVLAKGLSAKEVYEGALNAIRQQDGRKSVSFQSIAEARLALLHEWSTTEQTTLVLDDCNCPDEIREILSDIGGPTAQKTVVLTSNNFSALTGYQRFDLPRLSDLEVSQLIEHATGAQLESGKLDDIVVRSEGNPLYLRYFLEEATNRPRENIRAYEEAAIDSVALEARELLNYIALTPGGLNLADLARLTGGAKAGLETTRGLVDSIRSMVSIFDTRISIFHVHLQQTIAERVNSNTTAREFYAGRLGNYLGTRKRHTDAFVVFQDAGYPVQERLLEKAIFETSLRGEVALGERVLEYALAVEGEQGNTELAVHRRLALAQMRELAGKHDLAMTLLDEARALAAELPNQEVMKLIKEREAATQVWSDDYHKGMGALSQIETEYLDSGDDTGLLRIRVEQSAALIRADDFPAAEDAARAALELANKVGDQYGKSVATRNLISALIAQGDTAKSDEGFRLLEETRMDSSGGIHPRERAWELNMLARQARRAGEPREAEKYGLEAIAIGNEIGDMHVVAMNTINVGNAHRDLGGNQHAFDWYLRASRLAHDSGQKAPEAFALRLIASIKLDMGDPSDAEMFALESISVAEQFQAENLIADAQEVLGDALMAKRNHSGAAEAYIEAAKLKNVMPNCATEAIALALNGLSELVEDQATDAVLELLDGFFLKEEDIPSNEDGYSETDKMAIRFGAACASVPEEFTIDISGLICRLLFSGSPDGGRKYLARVLLKCLFEGGRERSQHSKMMAAAMVLGFLSPAHLTCADMVEFSETLAKEFDHIYFVPHGDGASHWTIGLEFSSPAMATIQQLDDRMETGIVAGMLALMLKGLETEIQERIIVSRELKRHEVVITVIEFTELKRMIPEATNLIGDFMDHPCVVSRPVNFEDEHYPMTNVICRRDIVEKFGIGSRRGSALQLLFGETLLEVLLQLFQGDIEMEILRPKLVSVVRSTIS